ncbi:TetR family transcriptional regulator [Prauserella sp. PE36]|uniref:TetR/AcrR family transcriptional regulator n=1 Tax=Prauserella endophytica TaxID=1592324 RepID=A0ABY2S5W3_9PSEU|nr:MULTISPECIES: TetR family transcriptional regulator [Prauserella]PXY23267.1 TetR family transcriptional regulator [Prauserella coralliicola]RBM18862.1 TetR family transcriptional regulator [Prauserella sp. PE36]TKG70616.1 TetR/AcrR family transcriptional regulator [Prauserella endophytica]
MSSDSGPGRRRDGELATVDRIRDAAIERFGRDGFGAGLRAIAADAGVAAGLVVHYFGSKQGLRRACDEHVLSIIRHEKTKALTDGSGSMMFAQLAEVERFAPYLLYLLRSLQAGGELAGALIEQMTADAEQYLAEGEAAGVVRPSRDRAARARYLAYQSTGGMLLWFTLHGSSGDPESFRRLFRQYVDEITPAAVELFSQGLLIDRSMLDAFLMYVPDPPAQD